MSGIEEFLLEFVTRIYEVMGWPGVVLLMAVENTGFPIPSEPVMMFAGWILVQAAGKPVWFVVLAGFYGSVGSLIGAWVVYFVSLKGGRPLLRRYGKYVLLSGDDIAKSEVWFAKYGNWAVFLGRLVPVVRTIISVPAGIAGMKLWKFSVYTFLGSLPWNVGLAYAGFLLGGNWGQFRSFTGPFEIPILIALVLVTGWLVFRRIRSMRQGIQGQGISGNLVSSPDGGAEDNV